MSERTAAPYGTWASPISAAMLVEGGVRLFGLGIEDGTIYWVEGRPSEGGRSVVVRGGFGARSRGGNGSQRCSGFRRTWLDVR